jgi:anti-anti-sigma factor
MVTFNEQDNEIICTFTGQLNTLAVTKDEPAVNEKIGQAGGRKVAFDLGAVDFIASSFLRLCLKTASTVGASRFSVCNITPEIKKVFVIAGLDKQITIT